VFRYLTLVARINGDVWFEKVFLSGTRGGVHES
jgi:hypothetical protein